ncbi:Copia protein [Cucumis melo var. makuwa]|uniref:Copia protein n=1 Tax=Cucumis melo var. makuwa TaxID=1194695 RepID=A0A5A7THQ8_CUCMM|nr:Copia protein [Cucumis melo var. makuwa]
MNLCKEIVWNCPSGDIQYSRIEKVDRIYVFLAGLNPNARSPNHDSERHNGKLIPIYEHCKKQWHTKEQCWKLRGCPPHEWFVTLIDDHTHLTWVFLFFDKSEVTSTFRNFYHTVEMHFHAKIAILQSDNGRKFQNHTLNENQDHPRNISKYDPSFDLPIALRKDWPLRQLDVKNAFLNGDSEEEVFTTSVKSQGYDHTSFTKVSKAGKIAVLIVYVDDIVRSGDDAVEIIQLKKNMENEFEIKDLGNMKYLCLI